MAAGSSNTHKRATPVVVAFLLLMPLALTALAGSAAAAVPFSEGWENGWGSWSVAGPAGGASIDCSVARSGSCSLKLAAPSTAIGQYVIVSNMPSVDMTDFTVVDFAFRGSTVAGSADAEFQLILNGGSVITYAFTESGPDGGNNRVRLSVGSSSHTFGTWSTANAWYVGRVMINPSMHVVFAELFDSSGSLGWSNEFPLLATDSAISQLRIIGVSWGSANTYHMDDIRVKVGSGVPSSPQALQATAGPAGGEISLSWTAPASTGDSPIAHYRIYRSTTANGEYSSVATTTSATWTDTQLGLGVTRHYRVSAVNADGEGGWTSSVSATTFSLPSAPQALQTSAGSGVGQITLTWTPPASNGGASVTSYKVYRSSSSLSGFTEVATRTTTSWTDSGLANGATWYYRVSAVTLAGEGPQTTSSGATTYTYPGAPTNPQATTGPTAGQITVSWTPPATNGGTGPNYYVIYRATASTGPFSPTAYESTTSWTDTGLSNGATRYYRISAVNIVGEGPRSTTATGTTATAPSTPQNAQAAPSTNAGEISLTWSPPTTNGGLAVTSYNIHRATTSSGPYTLAASSTTTSWLDTNLPADATRHYRLSAVNAVGESGLTSPVSATTHNVPSAPQALAAMTGEEAGEISLSWQPPLDNGGLPVTSYQIHAADAAGEQFTQVGTSTSASFLHEGLANGITKHYRIRAVNAAGAGAESNTATATTLRAPSAPQQLQAAPGPETIFLHWKAPADTGDRPIERYQVFRGTSSVNKQDLARSDMTVFADSVAPGVTYYYQVSALSAIGESPRSNEVKAAALGPTDSPSPGVRALFFLDNATLSAGELPSVPLLPTGTPPVDTPDHSGSDPVPTPDVDPTPGVGPVASLVVWDRAETDETCVDVVVGSTRRGIACWSHEFAGDELIPHEETPIGIPPTPGQDVPDAPGTDPQDVPDAEETPPGGIGSTPTHTPELKVSVDATYRFDAVRLWKAAGVAEDAIRVFAPVAPSNAAWWLGPEGAAQALVVRVTVWLDGEMLDTRELVVPHVGQALAAAEYTASTQP